MNPQDAWLAAYNQLELQLDRATFDTWMRPAVFLGVEDGVFVIGVQNSYAQDMLQHRLYRTIRRVLADTFGRESDIRFDVHKAEAKASAPLLEAEDAPLFRFLAQQTKASQLPETSETQDSLFKQVQRSTSRPELLGIELNPRYVFDRFVVNKSNQVVYEAALAVADYPATLYNPFLIYGGVGLGKTHLLQSIAHVCQQKGLRTIYIPSEIFTNDLVTAIRNRTTAMFREKYRSADVLLVDDIQFISGKDTTQEEFFHTFNALVHFNKQIVLASDRHPRELKTLEDRLRSRFQGGLVTDIQAPEYETRLAILEMWTQERELNLSKDTLITIAERAPSSVRELEGVFNQVMAQSRSGQVSMPQVEQTLERFTEVRTYAPLDAILEATAQVFKINVSDLQGASRKSRVNQARQAAMYIAREMTELPLSQIGEILGGRNHSTVLHGIVKVEEDIIADEVYAARIKKVRSTIKS